MKQKTMSRRGMTRRQWRALGEADRQAMRACVRELCRERPGLSRPELGGALKLSVALVRELLQELSMTSLRQRYEARPKISLEAYERPLTSQALYPAGPRRIAHFDSCTLGIAVRGSSHRWVRFAVLRDALTGLIFTQALSERYLMADFIDRSIRTLGRFDCYVGDRRAENESAAQVIAACGARFQPCDWRGIWRNERGERAVHQVKHQLLKLDAAQLSEPRSFARVLRTLNDRLNRQRQDPRFPLPVELETRTGQWTREQVIELARFRLRTTRQSILEVEPFPWRRGGEAEPNEAGRDEAGRDEGAEPWGYLVGLGASLRPRVEVSNFISRHGDGFYFAG